MKSGDRTATEVHSKGGEREEERERNQLEWNGGQDVRLG